MAAKKIKVCVLVPKKSASKIRHLAKKISHKKKPRIARRSPPGAVSRYTPTPTHPRKIVALLEKEGWFATAVRYPDPYYKWQLVTDAPYNVITRLAKTIR